MRRYTLRNDQWDRIEGILPGHKDFVAVTSKRIGCLSRRFCIDIGQGFRQVVGVKINGETFWLGRLIDSDGEGIKILLHWRRNAEAAIRFLKRALKMVGVLPKVMISNKLRSYKKAHRNLCKFVEHRSHKRLNNRVENSPRPT